MSEAIVPIWIVLALLPLAAMGWLLIGWLPSRMIKHYHAVTYKYIKWDRTDELLFLGMALLIGPLNWIVVPLCILLWGGKWGWKW